MYLAHTRKLSIKFNAKVSDPHKLFLASSDASFGNNLNTRQSSQEYAFVLFNGPEHPDTLTSMANLASIFSKQDRWKKAEELERHV